MLCYNRFKNWKSNTSRYWPDASYKLHLPTEQELIDAVEEEKKNLELNDNT